MPSVSGGCLQGDIIEPFSGYAFKFLCPRCRAGVYSPLGVAGLRRPRRVSMPSVSGGRLQHPPPTPARGPSTSFYALGGGRVFTLRHRHRRTEPLVGVSMPSVSGGRLQSAGRGGTTASSSGFYALGVGRAFTAPAPDPLPLTSGRLLPLWEI